MDQINEFNDEQALNAELETDGPREDGVGTWDNETPGPEQDENSVLNAEVTLAEPGLKQEVQEVDAPSAEEETEEQTPEQKNTPQEPVRRVLSFSDYFKS